MHRDDPEWMMRYETELGKAKKHMEFCCSLYRHQLEQGRHLLHEHPWSARLWALPNIEALLRRPEVDVTRAHICRFRMTSRVKERGGQIGLVKKTMGFISRN